MGLVCPVLRAGQSPRPVTGLVPLRVSACAHMYVRPLLMDFHPEQSSEEQEEDVGAGCIYQSAEFAVARVSRRVCAVHVFCVCSASLPGQTLGQGELQLWCLSWAAGFGSCY